jgi:hypothetical protein
MKSFIELETKFNKDVYELRNKCEHLNCEWIDWVGSILECPFCKERISFMPLTDNNFYCNCFESGKTFVLYYKNFTIPAKNKKISREKISYIYENYLKNVPFDQWNTVGE